MECVEEFEEKIKIHCSSWAHINNNAISASACVCVPAPAAPACLPVCRYEIFSMASPLTAQLQAQQILILLQHCLHSVAREMWMETNQVPAVAVAVPFVHTQ